MRYLKVSQISDSVQWNEANQQIEEKIAAGDSTDVWIQEFYESQLRTGPCCRVLARTEIATTLASGFGWTLREILPNTQTHVLIASGNAAKVQTQLKAVQAA